MSYGSLDQMLAEMKAGVYDFTVDGKCSNCGACCSDFLPISKHDIEQIKRYMDKHDIKECVKTVLMADTFDMTCPFRSDKDKTCTIYPVRPTICRDFRCDYPWKKISCTKKLHESRFEIVSMRTVFFGKPSAFAQIIGELYR